MLVPVVLLVGAAAAVVAAWWIVRSRGMDLWLPAYAAQSRRCGANALQRVEGAPLEIFICVCDHFEPELGRPGKAEALRRARAWRDGYPRLFGDLRDSRGRMPQHTFFYPADEYAPEYLDLLAELRELGCGDVEIHLHHHNDTAARLRDTLESFKHTLVERHGLLRPDLRTGAPVYGFIHGDWALCNSRPGGGCCGVNEEISILVETGCYADFTMPSAPDRTQAPIINSIYYAADQPGRPASHFTGTPARVGHAGAPMTLLCVQGPLVLDWQSRKLGLVPRIENGDLHAANPPAWRRFSQWVRAGVGVAGRPNWRFVKLHTHGAKPGNLEMWLNGPVRSFHQSLAAEAERLQTFRYYYVTAWELAQLVHQAENGCTIPDFEQLESQSPLLAQPAQI